MPSLPRSCVEPACRRPVRANAALCPFCGASLGGGKVQCVYFIKNEETGALKIGHTTNALQRIGSLQTGSDGQLVLLLAVEGWDRAREQALHRAFADLRIRADGEWFRFEGRLRKFVADLSRRVERAARTPATRPRGVRQVARPVSPGLRITVTARDAPRIRVRAKR